MTRFTCRLTAKNRDQLRNCTLGNHAWATFTLFLLVCGLNCAAADLLANGSRNRPVVGDRALVGAGYLASPSGLDVYQGQQSGVVARGVTPVPGASNLQRAPSSPLAPDVSQVCLKLISPPALHKAQARRAYVLLVFYFS